MFVFKEPVADSYATMLALALADQNVQCAQCDPCRRLQGDIGEGFDSSTDYNSYRMVEKYHAALYIYI